MIRDHIELALPRTIAYVCITHLEANLEAKEKQLLAYDKLLPTKKGHDDAVLLSPNLIDSNDFTGLSAVKTFDDFHFRERNKSSKLIVENSLVTNIAVNDDIASFRHGLQIS